MVEWNLVTRSSTDTESEQKIHQLYTGQLNLSSVKWLHTIVGAGTRDERVRGRLYANMLHHSEIRSRDIQGLFFSVAQSKNEDRDIEELQQ